MLTTARMERCEVFMAVEWASTPYAVGFSYLLGDAGRAG
jgi:hypothetical protein